MMIALEDLADYGYTVNYDNDNRMLFVNKTHDADTNFNPHIELETECEFAGYTYETDITAYVNGRYVQT